RRRQFRRPGRVSVREALPGDVHAAGPAVLGRAEDGRRLGGRGRPGEGRARQGRPVGVGPVGRRDRLDLVDLRYDVGRDRPRARRTCARQAAPPAVALARLATHSRRAVTLPDSGVSRSLARARLRAASRPDTAAPGYAAEPRTRVRSGHWPGPGSGPWPGKT